MLPFLKSISAIFLVVVLSSCSSEEYTENVKKISYSNDGVRVSVPSEWAFYQDIESTRFADKQLVFNTGGMSMLGIYIFYEADSPSYRKLNLNDYLEKILPRLLPEIKNGEATSVARNVVQFLKYEGVKVDVKSTFLGEMNTEVLSFMLDETDAKVIVVFLNEGGRPSIMSSTITNVLDSISVSKK